MQKDLKTPLASHGKILKNHLGINLRGKHHAVAVAGGNHLPQGFDAKALA